ncbi:MAG: peroxiredoxin, partial [Bacteroidetes bacterium RBG_13_46_8]
TVRIPLIGDKAPSFTGQSTLGEITFPDNFGKSWKILFAHPKDYTPVCSSELLELAYQQEEYEKLGVKIVVLSTDVLSMHTSWVKALEEIKYKDREPVKIKFPLVADDKLMISNKYGMIHPSASISENIRGVFIIDPNNNIRAINFYPMQVGRNMDEIKRTVIALQTIDASENLFAPANWNPGDKLMIPALS